MNIAFLTPEYPHPETGHAGGIGTSILNLAKGLTRLGHSVRVLVYQQAEDRVLESEGITIHRIKNIKAPGLSQYLTQKKVERLINWLYSEHKIDIVEAPDWTGFTAFIRVRCPLVIRLNGSDTYFCHLEGRPVKPKNRFLEKRALHRADGIMSVSAFTARLTKELFGLHKEMTVIPNTIDVQKFVPTETETEANILLYFGTLIRKKGLLELPHIFNEVVRNNPKAQLLLIGKDSGDKKTGSQSTWQLMQTHFSAEALQNVVHKGAVPYEEMRQHIETATVCVFPTFAEALPVSWLEAMAMEKAIVASDIGWAPEIIVDGQSGFLVSPKAHENYAARIVEVLDNKSLQERLGKAARKKVIEGFSIEVGAAKSVAFYKKIIRESKT